MLGILDGAKVRAVFFLIGTRVVENPALCRRIVDAGHGVGNHTLTHSSAWFWSLLPSPQLREISDATTEIEKAAGVRTPLFRAPVGFRNLFNAGVLQSLGMRHIGWSARGFDGIDTDIERVVGRIMRSLEPGAIILLHQGHPHHPAVLRRLLDELRAGGWCVVVPEALCDPGNH
jgi:peptidoglycan/xylan/chitin deacetylase (PgdA/CDA1 family)